MQKRFNLEIEKKLEGSECTYVLKGQLNSLSSPKLQSDILECIDRLSFLKFDMKDVDLITSSGLRVLLLARQITEDNKAEMILTGVNEDLMQMFETAGFLDILTIV